jgi:Xaa-Pro aminopeptidase
MSTQSTETQKVMGGSEWLERDDLVKRCLDLGAQLAAARERVAQLETALEEKERQRSEMYAEALKVHSASTGRIERLERALNAVRDLLTDDERAAIARAALQTEGGSRGE